MMPVSIKTVGLPERRAAQIDGTASTTEQGRRLVARSMVVIVLADHWRILVGQLTPRFSVNRREIRSRRQGFASRCASD